MQFLSLGLLPFFFFPSISSTPTAPAVDRGVQIASQVGTSANRTSTDGAQPRVDVGHRAAPSGCSPQSAVPSYDSASHGTPQRGRLSRGKFLTESNTIHHVDAQDCNFWGTDELTGMVQRVARKVAAEHPGVRLTVGELSKRRGGDIHGHGSHENGRDVDLGFYWVDEDGRPYEPSRFIDARRDKTAMVGGKKLTFDVERNWKIVEALLTDEEADLNIIVINARIRRWLLDYAREARVSPDLRRRASIVMRVPARGSHPHLNHFHVRIWCPEDDGQCRDRGQLWEWVEEARTERARQEQLARL